jgi:predicted enzyme related to lactoylglutathione lyase
MTAMDITIHAGAAFLVASRPRASTSGWCRALDRRPWPHRWTTGTCRTSAKLAEVTAAGATVKESPHDVGGGRLVATLTDPDGNVLGLLQDR